MGSPEDEITDHRTRTVLTTCSSHCGGRCTLRVHVKDEMIVRIDTAPMEEPRIMPCLRGRAYRQRVYDPGRLRYPLKRTGERGKAPPWESRNDPLASKYPLQLITTHFKRRAHSQFENIPRLRELIPQTLTMNSHDAKERGIKDGDEVKVFNDRGAVKI